MTKFGNHKQQCLTCIYFKDFKGADGINEACVSPSKGNGLHMLNECYRRLISFIGCATYEKRGVDPKDIKPCPFCGEIGIEVVEIDIRQKEGQLVAAVCTNCGAQGSTSYVTYPEDYEFYATKEWNTRAQ
jgi:Lar family restriction alleviation protein